MKRFLRSPTGLAAVFAAYFGAAMLYIHVLDRHVSKTFESAANVVLWPLAKMVLVAMPLLKRAGLTEGEWIVLPNTGGWIALGTAGVAFFYVLGVFIYGRKRS